MRQLDTDLLQKLSDELASLCNEMLQLESSLLKCTLAVHEAHRRSASNLAHYLALRRRDVRELQSQLALLGLSSLGRMESNVLDAVQTVHRVLGVLLGSGASLPCSAEPCVAIGEGAELLEKNTDALLGTPPPGRKVRIMVTMPSEAATDYAFVRDLVQSGMDCMRINCAHDNPVAWLGMIRNLQRARQETGRHCHILMDVAGPKLRTGPVKPGPSVVKCRPKRDVYGHVVDPARIWLTLDDQPEAAPAKAVASLPLPRSFLKRLRVGDRLRLRDARKAQRSLCISHVDRCGCWAEARQTIYFLSGLKLEAVRRSTSGRTSHRAFAEARIGTLPSAILAPQGRRHTTPQSSGHGRQVCSLRQIWRTPRTRPDLCLSPSDSRPCQAWRSCMVRRWQNRRSDSLCLSGFGVRRDHAGTSGRGKTRRRKGHQFTRNTDRCSRA